MTITSDEIVHLNYGMKILRFDSSRVDIFDVSKMPFSIFNAVPYIFAKNILNWAGNNLEENIQNHIALLAGRSVTILFSLLLGVYVFKWSKEMYGISAGIFSLFLYVFSPNIIAHSRLITADLYAALMITISTFYFWRFIKFGGWNRAIVSASVLGLSQLAKYTCIYLYPIFLTIILIRYSNLIFRLVILKNISELFKCLKIFIKYILLFLAINIVIINIGFIGNKSFTPLSKYEFKSNLFKTIQSVSILKNIPIPVPYPYVQGLDMVKFYEDTGDTFGNIYLLGKLKTNDSNFEGFKGYYFYAFLFKEPIATQLIIFLSIIAYILKRKKRDFLRNELFLLFPISFFVIYFNFFFKAQIGIRFFLVAFPLLYIFCGNLFEEYRLFNVKLKIVFVILSMYLIVSTLSYFPHYLSYFNEIVWDRKQAYKLLADSNIDWGQDEWYLMEYKRKNSEIKVNPEFPTSGRIVVSVNNLVGVVVDPERYKWLRENFEPVDSIAYSYLIYDIYPEDLKKISRK